MDVSALFMILLITVVTLAGRDLISEENLRIIASFASCLLMIKVYGWLQLFEKTAFYVKLVTLTIEGIVYFMILFVVALITFGLPLSMLDLNRDDGNRLIEPTLGNWLLDAVFNQYFLSLGDVASIENARNNP